MLNLLKIWKNVQNNSSKKRGMRYRSLSRGWEPLEVRSLLSVTPYNNYGELDLGNIDFEVNPMTKFDLENVTTGSTSLTVQDEEYEYSVTIPAEEEGVADTVVLYEGVQSFSKTTELTALTEDNWTYVELATWSYDVENEDTSLLGEYTYTFTASCIDNVYSYTFTYHSEDQTTTPVTESGVSYQSFTTLVSDITVTSEINETTGSGTGSDIRNSIQTSYYTGEEAYSYNLEEGSTILIGGVYDINESISKTENTNLAYSRTDNVWSQSGTYSLTENGSSDSSYTESGNYLETYSNAIDTGKLIGVINANGSTKETWTTLVSGTYAKDSSSGEMVWTYTGQTVTDTTEKDYWNHSQTGTYTRNYEDQDGREISLRGTDQLAYITDETTTSSVTSIISTNGNSWTSSGTSTTNRNETSTYTSDLHGTYTQILENTPITGYISSHLSTNETDTSVIEGTLQSLTGEWTYTGVLDSSETGSYNNDITFDNISYQVGLTDGTLSGKLGTLQTNWSESEFTSHFVLGYNTENEEYEWNLSTGAGTYSNGVEEGESYDALGTYLYEPEEGSSENVQSMGGTIQEYARNAYGTAIRQTFTVVEGEWSETGAVELETSTERTFYEDVAEGEYESGDVTGNLGRLNSSYYESRAIYEVTLDENNAVIACTVGVANIVSLNTSRKWLKGDGTLEIEPDTSSDYYANIIPYSGSFTEAEDSFYSELIQESYELENPEDYLDDDFVVDWQFDSGILSVVEKYRTRATYNGSRNYWCDQSHAYDYASGSGYSMSASSYEDLWNFDNQFTEDSEIVYALTESLLASSASGSGSGSGENSLSLTVLQGSASTFLSNKVETSTTWGGKNYTYTDDDGMVVAGTEDSTSRYTYYREMNSQETYLGSASYTPASGEFIEDGWLVRGSGKINETFDESGSYSGSASYRFTPDYYTYSSASGSFTESGNWRDNFRSQLTLEYKQSASNPDDLESGNYWRVSGTENGFSKEDYQYSFSADQTFTWDVYSGTQNEHGSGSWRSNSHYQAVYDNEQSDEWMLTSGSGSAIEDYTYSSALSASGSYSLSIESGSASIYGTSGSSESLSWNDRTEYDYFVEDAVWKTNMSGKTTQIATSASSYAASGSPSGTSSDGSYSSSWAASASEEGSFSKTENLEINWSFIDDEYSAVGNIHTEYDISGEYSYHGENSSWGSGSYTEEN
ncbi:MAG: hypothetical protein IJB48_01010, partial [Clostridia bacterium]|nr:hypothetical protein [Clostridia bacterium]